MSNITVTVNSPRESDSINWIIKNMPEVPFKIFRLNWNNEPARFSAVLPRHQLANLFSTNNIPTYDWVEDEEVLPSKIMDEEIKHVYVYYDEYGASAALLPEDFL